MIRYALVCDRGHEFESWFQDSARLRQAGQARLGELSPVRLGQGREGNHGAAAVHELQKAARAHRSRRLPRRTLAAPVPAAPVAMISPQEQEFRSKLKELRDHLTKNADNVGAKFP